NSGWLESRPHILLEQKEWVLKSGMLIAMSATPTGLIAGPRTNPLPPPGQKLSGGLLHHHAEEKVRRSSWRSDRRDLSACCRTSAGSQRWSCERPMHTTQVLSPQFTGVLQLLTARDFQEVPGLPTDPGHGDQTAVHDPGSFHLCPTRLLRCCRAAEAVSGPVSRDSTRPQRRSQSLRHASDSLHLWRVHPSNEIIPHFLLHWSLRCARAAFNSATFIMEKSAGEETHTVH
ncbi:integrator complex subunit 3 isoform X1, partial [Lates japonicus]